jgi:peroxiredoxin Q/BCP
VARIMSLIAVAMCLATPAYSFIAPSFGPSPFAPRFETAMSKRPAMGLRMALPATGAPAPAFEMPSSSGKTMTLKDFTGKWTVMYFYPKTFTEGCTCQAKNLEENSQEIKKLGATVVGVSTDPVEKHVEFIDKLGLSFTMMSDKGGEVAKAYGTALSIPLVGTFANRKTFIIDPKGNLAYVFDKVKASEHGVEVIAKLKELRQA